MARQNSSPVPPKQPILQDTQLTPAERIANLQRRRGRNIIIFCIVVIVLSLYLYFDVWSQNWGLVEVGDRDYAWLQWFFAGLAGTAFSQLWLAASGFEKIKLVGKAGSAAAGTTAVVPVMPEANFIQKTPTFLLNLLWGPIIVITILSALTNVTLAGSLVPRGDQQATAAVSATATAEPSDSAEEGQEIDPDESTSSSSSAEETSGTELGDIPLGFAIDLRKAQPNILAILAFLLGYYQKLANTVLDSIAKRIFGEDMWKKAYGDETANGKTGDDDPTKRKDEE